MPKEPGQRVSADDAGQSLRAPAAAEERHGARFGVDAALLPRTAADHTRPPGWGELRSGERFTDRPARCD